MVISHRTIALADDRSMKELRWLEKCADSRDIVVFLHGLGLDADDYRDYLAGHEVHAVAVTLAGFDREQRGWPEQVDLASHIHLVAGFLQKIADEYPDKKMVLVGFSLGADMIFQLAEFWQENPERVPPVTTALLLDPNVNQSTMTISGIFAESDPARPGQAFRRLLSVVPEDIRAIGSICRYVSKIAVKDFAQIWRLSRDMLSYWEPAGYSQIGARLAAVAKAAGDVRVVFSAPYEEHLEAVRDAVIRNGAEVTLTLTAYEHFDLIGAEVLADELQAVS